MMLPFLLGVPALNSHVSTVPVMVAEKARGPSVALRLVFFRPCMKMVSGEAREYAECIQAQARHTTQLVEELLDLGKIEAGMEAAQEACALDQILHEAIEAARFPAKAGEVTLVAEVAPLARPVRGNPVQLRQVVNNLVGNALKYTPAGGTVTVRA